MSTVKETNYTSEQEAAIRAASPMNMAKAEILAVQFGKKGASVRAKALRMGVPYEKKAVVSKSGEKAVRKETLVEDIGQHVTGSLEGLEKASKPALINILAAFEATAEN